MTRSAFRALFNRLQSGAATREEMDLLLSALQNPELASYFQRLLKTHFEKEAPPQINNRTDPEDALLTNQEDNHDGQAASELKSESESESGPGLTHKALDQLLARSWEIIDQQTTDNSVQASTSTSPSTSASELTTNTDADADSDQGIEPPALQFTPASQPQIRDGRRLQWIKAASILLIIALTTALLVKNQKQKEGARPIALQHSISAKNTGPIVPGRSAAILTLDNGQQLALDSNTSRQKIKNGDQLIAYNQTGQLNYQPAASTTDQVRYNTLSTQKGNRYQLVLPDGTTVWLNAESSIRFPDRFSQESRTVSITGEVYFEVQHDEKRPFTVEVGGQTVRDIGTAFNINAYEDEPGIKATLVEGIIEVNDTRLEPGWQASIHPSGKMSINKHADLAAITSWKNNLFVFHKTDMASILRQIARWYDVEIVYQGTFDQTFTGGISRETKLDEILKILSFSNKIKFEVHDRNIIVQPN